MAASPQFAGEADDELDFRPLGGGAEKSPRADNRAAAPHAGADAIDFRPAASTRTNAKPSKSAADGIDFTPAKTPPLTFHSLYETPQTGPSLTDRAARIGQPSPEVRAVAPRHADLTAVPRSPFTNQLEHWRLLKLRELPARFCRGLPNPSEFALGVRRRAIFRFSNSISIANEF